MARDWPAPRSRPDRADRRPAPPAREDGTYRLSESRPRHPRPAPAAPDRARPRRDRRRARQARRRDRRLSRHPALARPLQGIVKDELRRDREAFATPRRTEIATAWDGIEDEDLIQREDMVVTVSHAGYIKRVPLSTYRAQRRGGKGRAGMATKRRGFRHPAVRRLDPHAGAVLLLRGKVYKLKVWRLPRAAPQARGKAWSTCCRSARARRITTVMPLPEDEASGASSTSCSPPPRARSAATLRDEEGDPTTG
jgi:DNA gyrase subunit A